MTFTFDLTTEAGKVRLLIPDKVDEGHLFEDDEIDAFLELEGNNRKRATALALETAASDHALTLKVIRLLDLSTDGPAVARSLLERSVRLREQANNEEAAEEDGAFDIAEWTPTEFATRERRWNEMLRNG
jgi:hypothetical protein